MSNNKELLLNKTIDILADLLEEAYIVLKERGKTRLTERIERRLKELGRDV